MTILEYFQYYKEKSKEITYPDDNQELRDIHKKILNYCKFDINTIKPYIEKLISTIEEKEYKVGIKTHKYKQRNIKLNSSDGIVMKLEDGICDTAYIYPTDMKDNEIINDLYYFNENRISIINTSINDDFNINTGTFYAFHDDNSTYEYESLHCNKFPYLKRFLEKLVNIRIEKQNEELTPLEIQIVMSEVIEINKLLKMKRTR